MADTYRYKAFISYSHRDKAAGDRLLKDLENYRVPKRLVGKTAANGTVVPSRVGHIFRDRDELPAAEDLTAEVKKALTQSEFMIVLCSPAAAASRWVNREIIEFKKLTGERRILSVILSGEPFASGGGAPEQECFPPALRFKLGTGGTLTTEPAEPLAADFRAAGDGPRRGKLKLVAGLLGIGLDALIERDLQRKMRRVMAVTAASVLAMIGMASLTYEAVTARQDAERHRGEAEGLIEFMLTDLRDKLEPVGRLDVLDAVGEKAVDYYDRQALGDMPDDALGRRARAFHLLGEIDDKQGDLEGAREKFEAAYLTTATQLAQDPNNPDRIFDHSQSAYWVGFLNWQLGNYEAAEAKFEDYKANAEYLVSIDPDNPNWIKELAYANSNLGTLSLRQLRDPGQAAKYFEETLVQFKKLAEKKPNDSGAILEITDAHGWAADSYRSMGLFDSAIEHRIDEIDLYKPFLAVGQTNMRVQVAAANAEIALAVLKFDVGEKTVSLDRLARASKDLKAYFESDTTNSEWLKFVAFSYLHWTDATMSFGDIDSACHLLKEVVNIRSFPSQEDKEQLLNEDNAEIKYRIIFKERFLTAKLFYLQGEIEYARTLVSSLIDELYSDESTLKHTEGGIDILVRALHLQALMFELKEQSLVAAQTNWKRIKNILSDEDYNLSEKNQARLIRALEHLDENQKIGKLIEGPKITQVEYPQAPILRQKFAQFQCSPINPDINK